MKLLLLFITLSSGINLSSAAPRTWSDSSGSRTFTAEYVSHDNENVTVKYADGSEKTFAQNILHAKDISWLKRLNAEKNESSLGTAFDSLSFGDSRAVVEEKLAASKFVTTKIEKAFMGRTGLNGVYETTKKIGNLACFLYFDWDESGNLKEVTLHSETVDSALYDTSLKSTWSEMIDLINILHGKAVSASSYPSAKNLEDGGILSSHLWRTKEGNSVLMGTGCEKGKFDVIVRITTDKVEPVATR